MGLASPRQGSDRGTLRLRVRGLGPPQPRVSTAVQLERQMQPPVMRPAEIPVAQPVYTASPGPVPTAPVASARSVAHQSPMTAAPVAPAPVQAAAPPSGGPAPQPADDNPEGATRSVFDSLLAVLAVASFAALRYFRDVGGVWWCLGGLSWIALGSRAVATGRVVDYSGYLQSPLFYRFGGVFLT